jgi:manganese/zinc/iron transport system substrate-binding protein
MIMQPTIPKISSIITTVQIVLIALCTMAFLSGCSSKEKQGDENRKLFIVTTTGMIMDAVQNIGGEHVEVVALMGPGVDPHLYKATQRDLQKLTDADIIFYNGLHLEGKMGEVLEKLGKTKPVIAVSADIPNSLLRAVPGFQGTHDPHIWFDVSLWKHAVQAVNKSMQRQDTAFAKTYEQNTQHYLLKLDSLHNAVRSAIMEIPTQQRVLITAHDAFGYFGDAYNIDVRGLQGISTVSEFGLKDVTDLVDFIISRKIKAVFIETSVSQKSIEAVVEGCRQKKWNVKIGGSLYSDAMGRAGTPEGNYIGMVHANARLIVESLK